MASLTRVGIAGTGSYAPERKITNAWFEDRIDTSDEWIVQRTGIRERRWAADDQATSDLAVEAGRRAIEDAGLTPEDIDMVILGTLTPDHLLPSTACLVQEKLGLKNASAFDVNAACTGFMNAMQVGEAMIASGQARRVLAIGAETLSRFLDMEDRASCILFGDAAGAVVLAPFEECGQGEILKNTLGADGSGFEFIHMVGSGSREPATHDTVEQRKHFIRVRGREVYRFAVNRMGDLIAEMLEDTDPADLGQIVPHQVNKRIIDAAVERADLPGDKVFINIDRYANTSAATVPLALDQAREQGKLEKGKLVVMVAFGAGLTWGGSLVRW
jgi:3-oxoacyl-[acyl-carrier-protein] synthase-3